MSEKPFLEEMNGSEVKLYAGNFMLTLKVNTIQKP